MLNDEKIACELYDKYSRKLYNTALRITLSEEDADEIMQESIIRFMNSGRRLFLSEAKTASWLKTTCVRMSIDCLRRKKHFVSMNELSQCSVEDGEEDSVWNRLGSDLVSVVAERIKSLPDGYRTVLVMRLIEGYEYSEIAEMLGISETGARSQYMRARKRLSDELKKYIAEEYGEIL